MDIDSVITATIDQTQALNLERPQIAEVKNKLQQVLTDLHCQFEVLYFSSHPPTDTQFLLSKLFGQSYAQTLPVIYECDCCIYFPEAARENDAINNPADGLAVLDLGLLLTNRAQGDIVVLTSSPLLCPFHKSNVLPFNPTSFSYQQLMHKWNCLESYLNELGAADCA